MEEYVAENAAVVTIRGAYVVSFSVESIVFLN